MYRKAPSQALVEFALAVGVFMLLVLGTFDTARAYLAYTVVSNAAREASRYGAAHQGESGWTTAAQQAGIRLAVASTRRRSISRSARSRSTASRTLLSAGRIAFTA